MKKYLLALLILLLFPSDAGTELGKLIPVEAVRIASDRGQITMTTDTGNRGKGETLAQAVAALKESAPGTIYLETADYLLLSGEVPTGDLLTWFRPSAEICRGDTDPKQAAEYLHTHNPGHTLRDLRAGKTDLPKLAEGEGGLRLE